MIIIFCKINCVCKALKECVNNICNEHFDSLGEYFKLYLVQVTSLLSEWQYFVHQRVGLLRLHNN